MISSKNMVIPTCLNRFAGAYNDMPALHPYFEMIEPGAHFESSMFDTQRVETWFGSERYKNEGHEFLCFGMSPTSALYCFWQQPGASDDLNSLPIVILTEDGEGSTVLAENFEMFMLWLADFKGYDSEQGTVVPFDSNLFDESDREENERYREWLQRRCSLQLKSAESIFTRAQEQYPKAGDTIRSLC